jgi:hypothetical protein
MSDVIFIAIMIAFFVLCALYVQLCDHMIGPDDLATAGQDADRATDGPSMTMVSVGAPTEGEATT